MPSRPDRARPALRPRPAVGSLTYIVGNLIAGVALDIIPARHIIWLVAAGSIAPHSRLIAWSRSRPRRPRPQNLQSRIAVCCAIRFHHVVAASSLIQASHALFYGFGAVSWQAKGLDGAVIAALWALAVAAEIVLFAFSGRLPPMFGPTMLMMLGAAGAILRWGAMAFDPPIAALPWLQLLHALSFGATHLGALALSRGTRRRGRPRLRKAISRSHKARNGGRHGNFRRALRALRQSCLCCDDASGGRWRRLRCAGVSCP